MPREIKTLVYKFDELSDTAKKEAIDNVRDSENETFGHFHAGELTDAFCAYLEERGLPNGTGRNASRRNGVVEWSLNCCQGDGVAFYGPVDIMKALPFMYKGADLGFYKRLMRALDDHGIHPCFTVCANSYANHYSHYNTMYVDIEYFDVSKEDAESIQQALYTNDSIEGKIADLGKDLGDFVKEVSKFLEKIGYEEIDHLNSDEYITDMILCNDWEFTEDGEMT